MTSYFLIVILLMLAGIVLLMLELFLLPGFGVAGISSFASLTAAVVISFMYLNPVYPWAGIVVLLVSLLLIAGSLVFFFKSHAVDKMSLDTSIESSVDMPKAGKRMEKMCEEQDTDKESV